MCKILVFTCNGQRIKAADLCTRTTQTLISTHIMKKAGLIILVIGLVISFVTGLNFVTRDKVIDLGKVEVNANVKHSLSWSPVVGLVVMVVGAGVYLVGIKRV
jgi:divalent metal cation (Fe/Co/Zn/Cd) transporter